MTFTEEYGLHLIKNVVEDFAFKELERQLNEKGEEVCKCRDCVQDMACYTLNQLQPRYAVSLLGSLFSKADMAGLAEDIEGAVRKAIQKISQNPFHED